MNSTFAVCPMHLDIVNPLELSDWDERLAADARTTIFHTSAWARILAETYAYTPRYYTTSRGEPFALLPVMDVRSGLTGRRAVSLPFTDSCPLIAPDRDAARALLERALEDGCSAGWKYIELRGGEPLREDMIPSLSYFGHAIALRGRTEPELHDAMHESARHAVRKALRAGARVETRTDMEAVELFYNLNCRTRRAHGLPPQPLRFFRNIALHIMQRGMGCVVLAFDRQEPVAGAVLFHFGKRALFKYGASNEEARELRANNLVMWETIRWCAGKGFDELDLGRADAEHEGLRRFKRNLGGREFPFAYYKYDFRGKTFIRDRAMVTGWHNRVFRSLPAPLARAAGAMLYRHVA